MYQAGLTVAPHVGAGEIELHDVVIGKALAGHGVGAELAHAHLVAVAAAVEDIGAAGHGYHTLAPGGAVVVIAIIIAAAVGGPEGGGGPAPCDSIQVLPRFGNRPAAGDHIDPVQTG